MNTDSSTDSGDDAHPASALTQMGAALSQAPGAVFKAWSSWVPIRSLAPRHRARILTHLLSLGPDDRYLRFGYPASDEQIGRYAESLNFERDEVLGIFNRRLQLIAMAHLAYEPAPQLPDKPPMVEFGVSVLNKNRGRGFGARLFEHAALHARNRGIDTMFIHALSENTAMLRIARNAGATVERDGPDSEAWLRLPPDSVSSHVGEAIERHAAELDFQLKRHAHAVGEFIEAIGEVKSGVSDTRRAGRE
ncbi:GNAT family N-acetyltransferase [Roseateles toxinivorans]|uniref:Acetyltransferase (GNAT) family protein n=1 Tax=Roseateles toxinivorans TaxID=270368 RepID=A0A4R6QIG3_9BURK|nr:acetyltransferase (GNAT) family protein [Roseateles toxinivorans]